MIRTARLAQVLEHALRAPSVHNTQPWRWRLGGDVIDLFGPIVLDVRTVDELADDGAIFRARHVPLAELPRRLAEIPPQRPIVVYCADDYRSCVAASLLRRNGWNDVADLLGGYEVWTEALRNLPSIGRRPVPTAR